jgi:hypothetical protein
VEEKKNKERTKEKNKEDGGGGKKGDNYPTWFKTLHKTSFLIFDILLIICPNGKIYGLSYSFSNNVHNYVFFLSKM